MATKPDDGQELPAEELDAPTEEQPALEEQDNEPQPDPVADLAKDMGWVPQDQFRGPADQWKPAADFIRAGKDIQSRLSGELKEIRSTLKHVAATSASIAEQRINDERQRLQAEFGRAVEDGDQQGAYEASQKLATLRAPVVQPPSDVEAWAERNKWFKQHPAATALAVRTTNELAAAGMTTEQQLQGAEDEVRRAYPQVFGIAPAPSKGPAQVNAPTNRSAAPPARAKGFHDMPKAAQDVAIDMENRGVIKSRADYATHFFANQGK